MARTYNRWTKIMNMSRFKSLNMGQYPPGTDTVNASLTVCSLFQNEYHYSNYRLLMIVRKYLNNRSGVFTIDELYIVMAEHFGNTSRQSVLNKITTCVNHSDIPFMEKFGTSTWKMNSDEHILKLLGSDGQDIYRLKVAIPVSVLRLHREQYVAFMKLCMGEYIDSSTITNLRKKLTPIPLPAFTDK